MFLASSTLDCAPSTITWFLRLCIVFSNFKIVASPQQILNLEFLTPKLKKKKRITMRCLPATYQLLSLPLSKQNGFK